MISRLNPNDKFKIIYDAKYINNEFIKINKVYAAVFEHNNEKYYAIPFKDDTSLSSVEYFDEKGKESKKLFHEAPVEFKEYHQDIASLEDTRLQEGVKAHKGAVLLLKADHQLLVRRNLLRLLNTKNTMVTMLKSSTIILMKLNIYTCKKSVNYWKKKGIKPGKKIKQGEIIGFVGQTGLATGPHMCYRFWKNGK